MDFQKVLIRFFKSPLGLITVGLTFLGACLSILIGHLSALVVVPLSLVLLIVVMVLILQTGTGARSVVQESDRERNERDARILGGIAAARKRLSLLRLPDGQVKVAIDKLVYVGGLYLEGTVKGHDRDPLVEDAILSALEIVDEYLHRLDALKTEGRLAGQGIDPKAEDDLNSHTAAVLDQSVAEVQRRLGTQLEEQQSIASGELLS
uniref:Uncharacterized protein n=1 Tax=Gracilinema caldarium TaxID=215591 RepID=A0A7C3E592_9SPIR